MRLSDVLTTEHLLVPLEATSISGALDRLVGRLVETEVLDSDDILETDRFDDPSRDWIRVGRSALVAHHRSAAVSELTVGLGIAPTALGTDGDSNVRIVALVVGPPGSVDSHLRVVAATARILREDEIVERLLAAGSPEDVLAIDGFVHHTLPVRLTVRDIMTQRVYRVYADTPLAELLSLMSRHHLRAVPVVAEKREVMGIVTDRDVLRYLMPRILRVSAEEDADSRTGRAAIGEARVRDVMSRSVMCVSEDQSIAEVTSLMVNKDVERFPVVHEGRLTGFLTRGDIIRKMFGHP